MKKIAIFRRNGLGDLLQTFPLILYLKKQYPACSITLFTDPLTSKLLKFLPPLDEVVLLPNKGNKYFGILSRVWHWRNSEFDIAISAKTSPMKLMNFALFILGAKERYAYVDESWHSCLINKPHVYNLQRDQGLLQALKSLRLIAPHLNHVPEEYYPKMTVPFALCQPYLKDFDYEEPTIFISASTTKSENRFDSLRYAYILNELNKKHLFRVVLNGMEKDELRAKLIASHLQVPNRLYLTRTLEEMVAILRLSDMVFVGDGGIAHMAAALAKPQVVLFGQTHPRNWHPLSSKAIAFYHPIHVNSLSDEKIYEALEYQLKRLLEGSHARHDHHLFSGANS